MLKVDKKYDEVLAQEIEAGKKVEAETVGTTAESTEQSKSCTIL